MTKSPSLELQEVLVAHLKADAAVAELVGDRIYDRVPKKATYPYVSLGPSEELDIGTDTFESYDCSIQIDCWSTDVGGPEAKRISNAVRDALDDEDLPLSANNLVSFSCRQVRIFPDQDGLTTHAVLTFESDVEQPQE